MKKTTYLAAVLGLTVICANAQERSAKKADKNFKNYEFSESIENYGNAIDKGYSSSESYKNLGDANYYNANYEAAAMWYGKLMETDDKEIDAEYLYRYGQSLKSTKEYEASEVWMAKFQKLKEADGRAKKWTNRTAYRTDIANNSGKYEISSLPINSASSDFAPSYNGDYLVFTTARDTGMVEKSTDAWSKTPFLNLHKTNASTTNEFTTSERIGGKINRKTHESSTVFTKDGSTVYFTRNHSKNGRFARDKEGLSRLQLFRATLKDEQWINITALPFNSPDYSTAHPALSVDEKQLYFSSDMPGSLGGSDIFVVDILKDGGFSEPKNLGSTINTEGRESFPFVSASQKLYFASDGHPGLGGLDVFVIALGQIAAMRPMNMGESINSEKDDFSLIINEADQSGFFASNRDGGRGNDDIYRFKVSEPLYFECKEELVGTIFDENTQEILANTLITLKSATGIIISSTQTDANGNFAIDSKCMEGDFEITATKDDYELGSLAVSKEADKAWDKVTLRLKQQLKGLPNGTDLAKHLAIEPIYFDFDKWNIREDAQQSIAKVIIYLKANPLVRINVRSHTDARGNAQYNQQLSLKRAKNTVAFMVANGIAEQRVQSQGLGESELRNNCAENQPCSRAKHQENRRSEFIVIE